MHTLDRILQILENARLAIGRHFGWRIARIIDHPPIFSLARGAATPIDPVSTLFLVVFLDLIGFGMIIPVFPFYAEQVGVAPASVIFFLGLYSLGQLVGAPIWGSLSDRIGRRPVLLITLLANAGATVLDEPCVVDGNLITARFPYDLPRLVDALVKQLVK